MNTFKTLVLLFAGWISLGKTTFAQTCILYTRAGDTVQGTIQLKHLKGRLINLIPGSTIDRIDLQEGLRVTPRHGAERRYLPSEVQEAFVFPEVFDTLHLLSVSRKNFFPALVMETVVDTSTNSHVLVESSEGNGPLIWCTYHLKTEKNETTKWDKQRKVFITTSYEYQTQTELIRLHGQWHELPEGRNYKNEMLVSLLTDCPDLVEKLRKSKINVARKMAKVVSLYNNCRNQ